MQTVQPVALHRSVHSCPLMVAVEAARLEEAAALAAARRTVRAATVRMAAEAALEAHMTLMREAKAAHMAEAAEALATACTVRVKAETVVLVVRMVAAAEAARQAAALPPQEEQVELKEHTAEKAETVQTKAAVVQMEMPEQIRLIYPKQSFTVLRPAERLTNTLAEVVAAMVLKAAVHLMDTAMAAVAEAATVEMVDIPKPLMAAAEVVMERTEEVQIARTFLQPMTLAAAEEAAVGVVELVVSECALVELAVAVDMVLAGMVEHIFLLIPIAVRHGAHLWLQMAALALVAVVSHIVD